jgi:hypothetical protein
VLLLGPDTLGRRTGPPATVACPFRPLLCLDPATGAEVDSQGGTACEEALDSTPSAAPVNEVMGADVAMSSIPPFPSLAVVSASAPESEAKYLAARVRVSGGGSFRPARLLKGLLLVREDASDAADPADTRGRRGAASLCLAGALVTARWADGAAGSDLLAAALLAGSPRCHPCVRAAKSFVWPLRALVALLEPLTTSSASLL